MKAFEQRKYFNAVIFCIAKEFFNSEIDSQEDAPIVSSPTISGAASLLHTFVNENDILKEHLVSSLTRSTIPSIDDSLAIRRSVIAALAQDEGEYWKGSALIVILIRCRQGAITVRKLHQNLWRFCLHQAYTCITARRLATTLDITKAELTLLSSCANIGFMLRLRTTITTHVCHYDGEVNIPR
jgi:hypothetical protein